MDVIIPAFNEEGSIAKVIQDIPESIVRDIIVCNNGSTDATKSQALKHGATVVDEVSPGYGSACLKGISYIKTKDVKPDIVVFLDGDYSDYPEEMTKLISPISSGEADMVIGSRSLGHVEAGAMTPQQLFGNWLATNLIKLFYGVRFTDLGPFRAITWDKLLFLNMVDRDYGWTVEMQVKAAKLSLNSLEVPVSYRKRIGHSKISGTIKGTILAGHKIIWTIFKLL